MAHRRPLGGLKGKWDTSGLCASAWRGRVRGGMVLMEFSDVRWSSVESIRPSAGKFDDLAPLLGFLGDEAF